jgi:hypothetical protein
MDWKEGLWAHEMQAMAGPENRVRERALDLTGCESLFVSAERRTFGLNGFNCRLPFQESRISWMTRLTRVTSGNEPARVLFGFLNRERQVFFSHYNEF